MLTYRFPATEAFPDFGSIGVSMFFMSYVPCLTREYLKRSIAHNHRCIVSQLVFSCGGSIFTGGNGSMMIEAVPFFHLLITYICKIVGGWQC